MILDSLDCADRYISLHKGFRRAFEFLERASGQEPGRVDLDGRNMYCTVSAQAGKSRGEAYLESHRKYIDIHYCIEGEEEIGWRSIEECEMVRDPYDAEKDLIAYHDSPAVWLKLTPGTFAIFFPEDAHAPLVASGTIRKAVVKVLR